MALMRQCLICILCSLGAAVAAAGGPVRATAVGDVADPGSREGLVGVLLEMEPGWHVYWRHPGASGVATEVTFEEGAGLEVGALRWPLPVAFADPGGGTAYGYSGEVMLLAPVRPTGEGARSGRIRIAASWLACRERCVLGEAELELPIPVPKAAVREARSRLQAWKAALPRPAAEAPVRPVVRLSPREGGALGVEAWLWWKRDVARGEWFPTPPEGWTVQVEELAHRGRTTRMVLRLAPKRADEPPPGSIDGVAAAEIEDRRRGWELRLRIGTGGGS